VPVALACRRVPSRMARWGVRGGVSVLCALGPCHPSGADEETGSFALLYHNGLSRFTCILGSMPRYLRMVSLSSPGGVEGLGGLDLDEAGVAGRGADLEGAEQEGEVLMVKQTPPSVHHQCSAWSSTLLMSRHQTCESMLTVRRWLLR
jgi:hypothetical protein